MEKFLTSILIGLCIFLGNISSHAKSIKLVEHISSEHSTHKKSHSHHHGHHHHHKSEKKSSKATDHHHTVELSLVTVYLALPSLNGIVSRVLVSFSSDIDFYSLNVLNQLSFSPPVFRPPIS